MTKNEIQGIKMTGHEFNFDGGKLLTRMSASWFVSYAYYEKIDSTHMNWKLVSTWKTQRLPCYNRSRSYHKYWLQEVLEMDDRRLNTNKISLPATETKEMAKRLLEIM